MIDMAERRMFAKAIVLSDAFLDMPLSARCLYFTLGMFADDDGFVGSPKGIMRQCGASQDDMLVLIQKRFVLAFDSGVIVIKHWRINNYLRNDRYQSTTYIEEKETLELDDKNAYTEKDKNIGIPYMGIPSIDKDRLDKKSIGKESIEEGSMRGDDSAQDILALYRLHCPSLPDVRILNDKRRKHIKALLKAFTIEEITEGFKKAEASDFCKGKTGWKADFEFLINQNNMAKVLEGKYDNRDQKPESIADRWANI